MLLVNPSSPLNLPHKPSCTRSHHVFCLLPTPRFVPRSAIQRPVAMAAAAVESNSAGTVVHSTMAAQHIHPTLGTALIDGKAIAATIRQETAAEVQRIKELTGKVPGLAVVLVGARKDSETYVRNKKKACEEVGIASFGTDLPEDVSEEELLKVCSTERVPALSTIHNCRWCENTTITQTCMASWCSCPFPSTSTSSACWMPSPWRRMLTAFTQKTSGHWPCVDARPSTFRALPRYDRIKHYTVVNTAQQPPITGVH